MGIFEERANSILPTNSSTFALASEAQAVIAQRNVQFPAVESEHVDLDEEFDQYAHVPPEAVTIGYDDLRGTLDGWVENWARIRQPVGPCPDREDPAVSADVGIDQPPLVAGSSAARSP